MANVKPFKAIRPSSALAAQVAALPYDVYNREEAAETVIGRLPRAFLFRMNKNVIICTN